MEGDRQRRSPLVGSGEGRENDRHMTEWHEKKTSMAGKKGGVEELKLADYSVVASGATVR